MIRIVLVIVVFVLSQVTYSQTKFEQGMEKAFQLMTENKNDEASNMLERIASAEPMNWLPPYHIALLKARTSFTMTDKTKQEAQIKLAEDFIATADALSPNNSEVHVVMGMINTAKIVLNPMVNGATLSEPTIKLYRKAIALDKTNPRAYSGLAEFEMGGARFFKQDLTPYCKRLQKSIKMYDDFKPASKYAPNWGKDWTLQVLKGCGDMTSTKEEAPASTTSAAPAAASGSVTITATVPNVSGTDGDVIFALYDSSEAFASRAPIATSKSSIANGSSQAIFKDVKPGTYAIVVLHDKNGNERMDFEPSGMPKEDYGASNNKMKMGPPSFADAKFTVENKSLDLTIRF